ncbi:MAG: hypothetical protein J2P18_20215 [Nocardia sp.]|nr:hypothetical protein [Nocardia sp.]
MFEVELAAALTGAPMRADAELDPATLTALSRVEVAPAEHRWVAAQQARGVFERNNAGTDFGVVPDWIAARCVDAATTLAGSAISWHTAQLSRTGADVYLRHRDECLADLAALNPRRSERVAAWIEVFGARWARWRSEAGDDGHGPSPWLPNHQVPFDPERIFDTEIAPRLWGTLATSPDPVAVVVSGLPGSGTAAASARYAAVMPGAAVVRTNVLAGFHPRRWDAGSDDAEVTAAVREWLLRSVRQLVGRRADAVVEVVDPTASAEPYISAFEQAGYRVHREMVSIPEPLRRLSNLVGEHTVGGQWAAVSAVAGGAW